MLLRITKGLPLPESHSLPRGLSYLPCLSRSLVNATLPEIRRDEEIDSFQVRLYFFSRDPGVLFSVAAGLLAVAIAVAWFLRGPDLWSTVPKSAKKAIQVELGGAYPNLQRSLDLLPAVATQNGAASAEEGVKLIREAKVTIDERMLLGSYWDSLVTFTSEPNAGLLMRAHQVVPLPGANELIADLHASRGKAVPALNYYEREFTHTDSHTARAKFVQLLIQQRNYSKLRELSADLKFNSYFTPRVRLNLALHDRAWTGVARALTDLQKEAFKPLPLTLAAVAGLVWFTIAFQAIQPPQWIGARSILPVLAVLAGLISTWGAHFLAVWQQEMWGMRFTSNFLSDFIFHLGVTAPREELIKLLLLIPFLPILLRRGSRLEMLVVSGCVGLGFAIEGNLQSYEHEGPAGAFGRLLTANFFHLAATGLAGLALCEALLAPRTKTVSFILTLIGVIVAHGVYDAFMSVQGARVLSLLSMLSFLALSLLFFSELRRLRDPATDQLYISATLLIGMALLTGTMFVFAAMQLGFPLAATSLAANAAGLIIVVCLFYRQLGRGLAPVGPEFSQI